SPDAAGRREVGAEQHAPHATRRWGRGAAPASRLVAVVRLRENLGALQERDFRLLFSGTVITTVGDRLAGIALAFAVLDIGSATDRGIVFAVRQVVEALVLVGGGVLSDRLPRNLVIGGASL